MPFKVLYLSMIVGVPSHRRKLAGIHRYCDARGWEVVPVLREDSSAESVKALLQRHRPIGCVVEGVGSRELTPVRLFRGIPVSFIAYPRSATGNLPNYHFDVGAIVATAMREFSARNPPCYAAIGHPLPWNWSLSRVRRFRQAASAAGANCFVFPS